MGIKVKYILRWEHIKWDVSRVTAVALLHSDANGKVG